MGEGPASDGAVAAVGSKDPQSSPPLSKDNGGTSFWPQWPPFTLEQPELNNGSIRAELPKQTQVAAEDDFRPYFLDIFCGTAGVAAALKRYGAEALGVDHVIDKRRMKGPAVKLDLTLPSSQRMIFDEIKSGRVKGVMLAPPCGTSSKARNIPIRGAKGKLRRGPPPLRSEHYPQGLPGLRGLNRTRVRQANKLYRFCGDLMKMCAECNVLCIVENPQSSLFWLTKWMRDIPEVFVWHVVHACMYGSKRLKKTGLLINFLAPNCQMPWVRARKFKKGSRGNLGEIEVAQYMVQ